MKSSPSYFSYFTQSDSPYFDISWMNSFDMSWIDDLNEQQKKEFEEEKKDAELPDSYHSSDDGTNSKDLNSVDFPLSHHWPAEFKEKFKYSVKESKEKIASLIKDTEQVIEIEELEIYTDCPDGNHYFSTRFYANGDIQLAAIDNDSEFDSVDTAVYAFVNDWNDWNKEHGSSYRKAIKLSELVALREPRNQEVDIGGCDHEDLGSLGYIHGSTVKCPFCGNMAEVW
jgi:hypothetical protein